MKLKHMHVQFNRIPNRAATLYYAVGEENGKTYESHLLVNDSDTINMNDFQLDTFVTLGLTKNITELTHTEMNRRANEAKGVAFV